MNESPAPTVSLTSTFGAGAQTREPRSQSAAPAAPIVTQIRGTCVASEKIAQASATELVLEGGLFAASPVRNQEAIWPTSSWLSLRISAHAASSTICFGSANGGRRLTSKNFKGPFTSRRRSNWARL